MADKRDVRSALRAYEQPSMLQSAWDEISGAFARYGRRSGAQRDASLAMLNQAVDPNTDPLTGAGMKALGLAGLVTHPLAFLPTREEWDQRLQAAGNDSRVSRSIGGMLSDLPSLIDPQMAAGGAVLAAAPLMAKMGKTAGKVDVFPELANRYPAVGAPVLAVDKKSGKEYLAKALTPEAEKFEAARKAVIKDMDANGYTPYFDPAKRFDADRSKYDPKYDTGQIQMKKPDTRAKYDAMAGSPEAKERLQTAYERGMLQKGDAGNWYHMGQLEEEFIKELGPDLGRKMFKERFADAMAATTGGADPTSNLLMAAYGNFLKANPENQFPKVAYEMPYPIGGRYASGNMDQFRKMLMEGGTGVTEANPKRYNFSDDFIGGKDPTIDEQMMGLFDPELAVPAPGTYGHYQNSLADLAKAEGVDPRWYQEVAWAGAKDAKTKGGYKASPMISHVNAMIERTARLTGQSPKEVLRQFIRAKGPMYSVAPAGFLAAQSQQEDQQ